MWNSKTTLAAVHELLWGMFGKGDAGLRGIGVSGSGYNEVLALEVLNVVDCVERKRRTELLASGSVPLAVAAALFFQACLRGCICTCCMCVRICMYVCVYEHAYMYISACVYVWVYTCMYIHVCMYFYKCVCIDFESSLAILQRV